MLRFRSAQAKIKDSRRNYTEAAQYYYNLATEAGVDEDASLELYNNSITCAIISTAGPRKDRILDQLRKDKRFKLSIHHELLDMFAKGSVIRPARTKSFVETLQTHQKATVKGR